MEIRLLTLRALGKKIFYHPESSLFFLDRPSEAELSALPRLPDEKEWARRCRPVSYVFCLDISDACNLACSYCFNSHKSGRVMKPDKAIELLEKALSTYNDGEKYFIDLSGKGEPLLSLKTVLSVADWAYRQANIDRREYIVQFVTNGTLLNREIVSLLQKKGILFGISIDGRKDVHDAHRLDKEGRGTYEKIISNVKAIERREFLGVGVSIGKDVFPLLETIEELASIFKTISIRPLRGKEGIDTRSESAWEKEYDRLSLRLLEDGKKGDARIFLPLMNGDDYFGRYLVQAFSYSRSSFRCDAGIGRIAIEENGRFYPCPALALNPDFELPDERYQFEERHFALCAGCPLKRFCGGDCLADVEERKGQNKVLCKLRRHLIALSAIIERTLSSENIAFAAFLQDFSLNKLERRRKNDGLYNFLKQHSDLAFNEAKAIYEANPKSY